MSPGIDETKAVDKAELAVKNFSHAIRICSIDGFAIVAVAFAYTVL